MYIASKLASFSLKIPLECAISCAILWGNSTLEISLLIFASPVGAKNTPVICNSVKTLENVNFFTKLMLSCANKNLDKETDRLLNDFVRFQEESVEKLKSFL